MGPTVESVVGAACSSTQPVASVVATAKRLCCTGILQDIAPEDMHAEIQGYLCEKSFVGLQPDLCQSHNQFC